MQEFDKIKGEDRVFCAWYLILGYTFIWMFTANGPDWCLTVYTIAYAMGVLLYTCVKGIRPVKESWFWLVILLAIGIPLGFYSCMWFLQFPVLMLVAAYWTLAVSGRLLDQGKTSGWVFFDWWNALGIVPFLNMDAWIRVLFHQNVKLQENKLQEKEEGNKMQEHRQECAQTSILLSGPKAVVLGLGIAAVLLCILLPLLASADAGFDRLVGGLTGWVTDWITGHLFVFALRMCFAVPVTFYLFGLIYGGLTDRHTDHIKVAALEKTKKQIRILPVQAMVIAMAVICGVYLLFIGLQGTYLFSALAGKLPVAFTYAEYARRGFFELCQIALWNLCILWMAELFTCQEKNGFVIIRGMHILLSALTLLLIATAAGKMLLYIRVYGLTVNRVLPMVFMLWMAFVFLTWIFHQKRKFPILRISIFAGAILYSALCVLPVEKLCNLYNLWAQTHGFLH